MNASNRGFRQPSTLVLISNQSHHTHGNDGQRGEATVIAGSEVPFTPPG